MDRVGPTAQAVAVYFELWLWCSTAPAAQTSAAIVTKGREHMMLLLLGAD